MLKDFYNPYGKSVDATYKADGALTTGMGVIKGADNKCAKPSADTVAEIFFVDKEHYAKGINTAHAQYSDYFSDFNDVASGEYLKLRKFTSPDVFGTSVYDDDANEIPIAGRAVMVNADGEVEDINDGSTASKYICDGYVTDNGHTLCKIRVADRAVINSVLYAVAFATLTNGTATASLARASSGSVVTITPTPNAGYGVVSVAVAKTSDSSAVTVTNNAFTMPAGGVTITVTFGALHDITIADTTNGTVSVSQNPAPAGSTVTITSTPDEGKTLVSETVTDEDSGNVVVTSHTFTMPAKDVTVTVVFSE